MDDKHLYHLIARKLSGEATVEELAELQRLMEEQPDMKDVYGLTSDHWDALPQPHEGNIDAKYLRLWQAIGSTSGKVKKEKIHFNIPRFNTTKWLSAAACILLAVAIAVYFQTKNAQPSKFSEVSTKYGSRTNITLPDGSKVWLNAGSRIAYDPAAFHKGERTVHLTGEAFFDIEPVAKAPFTVQTEQAKVQVLGTRFNVKTYPGDGQFETSLITGAVVIVPERGNERPIGLKPGQRLVLTEDIYSEKAGQQAIDVTSIRLIPLEGGTDSLVLETAWTENKLAFTSEPFHQLAAKIERWYNVKINFADTTVKNYSFTGVFEGETLEQALGALQFTGSFKYRIVKNEVFIEK